MLSTADVALAGEAGTWLGEWLAPVAEGCHPGTEKEPLSPGTRKVVEVKRGVASGAAVAAACSGRG